MTLKICHSLTVLLLLVSLAAAQPLQTDATRIIHSTKLGKASFGLLVTDVTNGRDVASLRADELMIPASNLKLITTAAALSKLGKDHAFTTELRMDGHNLVIRGDGDPGFLDPVLLEEMGLTVEGVLSRWIDAVKRTGRKEFDAILVDDRIFDQQFEHPNWPRNQLHHWYCAQVAGLNFNDNCLDFYATPTSPGRPLIVRLVPEGVPVTLENSATTGSGKPLWLTRHLGGNRIVLKGQSRSGIVSPEFITIHDPPMVFGGLIRNRLNNAGINVRDVRRPLPDERGDAGVLLAAVETTLSAVLLRTNRDSQNLFAEALVKYLGHHATGEPGTWESGLAVISDFVTQTVGLDATAISMDDGSGMSRENRVSPRALVSVMQYMQRDPVLGPVYMNSLARPGQRGTLRKRLTNGELAGELYGKSGYINGTITLSGYLVTGGRPFAYAMLLNNYANGGLDAKRMMEKILIAVDQRYADEPAPALGG